MKQSINLWWVWLRLSCDEAHYLQTCFFLTRIGNIELAFRFSCFKSLNTFLTNITAKNAHAKCASGLQKTVQALELFLLLQLTTTIETHANLHPWKECTHSLLARDLKSTFWMQCCQETVWTVDVRLHFCFPPNENLTTGCLSNTLTLLSGRHMPSTVKVIAFQACAACLHNVLNRGLS